MPAKTFDLGTVEDIENVRFVVHVGSREVRLLVRDLRVNVALSGERIVDVEVALTALDPGEGSGDSTS